MQSVQRLQSFEQIKILADPRRLSILRALMARPASLSQLGRAFGEHPAWIRHHLKQLERAGLVEMSDVQTSGGFVEKFYQASAPAYILQQTLLPDDPENRTLLFMGSHDLALELLSEQLHQVMGGSQLLVLPVGSLDGLVALRQGATDLTGCHLLDTESGVYNSPYVRHFFPDRPVVLVTLALREQGLLVAPGNPHQIRGLEDLSRPDITLINRNKGSGTRLWLDHQLQQIGIQPQEIQVYPQEAATHTSTAIAIQNRQADVGLGLRAAANRFGLTFIPLFQERYDLVIPQQGAEEPRVAQLLDHLASSKFRHSLGSLPGYEGLHTGETLSLD